MKKERRKEREEAPLPELESQASQESAAAVLARAIQARRSGGAACWMAKKLAAGNEWTRPGP